MVDFSAPYNGLIAANNAPAQNPLTTASQAIGVQNQGLQNKLLQGQVQLQQPQIDDAKLANAKAHMDMMAGAIAPLINMGPNVTLSDVTDAGTKAIARSKGMLTPEDLTTFMLNLPTDGPSLQQALIRQHIQTLSAGQQIDAIRGQTSSLNNGGKTNFMNQPAYGGAPFVQGSIQNTLSPEGAVAPQTGPVNPLTGARTSITTGQRAEQAGLAAPGTYTNAGNSASPAAGAISVNVNRNGQIVRGAAPSASSPGKGGSGTIGPNGPQPSVSPPAGPGGGGFGSDTSASMPMGSIETDVSPAKAIALKGSGDQYQAAVANQSTYAQQLQQLQSGLTALQSTGTGPGTESRQAISSYMLALPGGIGQYLPGVDPKSIAAYDEANKYLTQTAQGSPNATRSDAGLNTALAASPSVHISNAAAQDVQKANIGFRRAQLADVAAFQNSGKDPGQFSNFVAQRNQQIDPRGYSVDLLSPAQRQSFIGSLSPAGKTKFFAGVRDAIGNGIINPSSLSGGAGGQ